MQKTRLAKPNAVRVPIAAARPLRVANTLAMASGTTKVPAQGRSLQPVPHEPVATRLEVAAPEVHTDRHGRDGPPTTGQAGE